MDFTMISMFAFMVIALVIIATMLYTNRNLRSDKRELYAIISLKNQTISNYEASRVAVEDILKNISLIDKVTPLLKSGKSRAEIAKQLNIDIERVEIVEKLESLRAKGITD